MCAFHRGLTVGGRRLLCLGMFSLLVLGSQGSNAGEMAPFPAPGRWEGRFSNEFEETGTLSVNLEKNRDGYAGTIVSVSDDSTEGPPATIMSGEKNGKNFVLTGEIWLPIEGGDAVPGWLTLIGVASGGTWDGTYRIMDEDGVIDIGGKFALTRSGGTAASRTGGGGIARTPASVAAPLTANSTPFTAGQNTLYDKIWGMPAITQTIPAGWSGEYEVQHFPEGRWDVAFTARKPETGQWVQRYPKRMFSYVAGEGNLWPGMLQLIHATRASQPLRAEEVTRLFLNYRQRQNVKVVSQDQGEQVEKARAQVKAGLPPPSNMNGFINAMDRDVDTLITVIEYEENGQTIHERIDVAVNYTIFFTANTTNMAPFRHANTEWDFNIQVIGGPAELFNQPLVDETNTIFYSLRPIPQWQALCEREALVAAQAKLDSARDQSALTQQIINTQRQVAESRRQVLNDQADAQRRAFNNMTDVIVGVEKVQSPYGGEIKIDYSKNHVWIDRNGKVMYSDNSLFNPNELPNSSGTYLQIK